MAVKKVVIENSPNRGSIDLSRELTRVREAITQLPTEEGVVMNENQSPNAAASTPSVKKVTKKPAAEPVKLADLCRQLKMKPQAARRVLRDKKVKNPGRWTWPKNSPELKRVTALLKPAAK